MHILDWTISDNGTKKSHLETRRHKEPPCEYLTMTARVLTMADDNKSFFKYMNGSSALDWIRMGNLDPLIGEDIKRWVSSILSEVKIGFIYAFITQIYIM